MKQVAKIIGTSLAIIGLIGASVVLGVGVGALIIGASVNLEFRAQLFNYSVLGFSLIEMVGLFIFMSECLLICFIPRVFWVLSRKIFNILSLFYNNITKKNFSSFSWSNLGLRLLVTIFFYLAYKYPYMFMSSQLGISKYWFIVFSVISFILLQFIFFELGLLQNKPTLPKLIILFLVSLFSVAFLPVIFHALLLTYSDLILEFLHLLKGFHFISIAEACDGSEPGANQNSNIGNNRDNYKSKGVASSSNPRRSVSPVQKPVSENVQLPSLRSQVQRIPPMGAVAPQNSAIAVAERVTKDAMGGINGYLPSNFLFDDENNYHAYNIAEWWYRGNMYEKGMFSTNQKTYVSRLVLEIEKSLVSTYNRENNMETNLAAQRLAAYHFKQNFEKNNNFER